MSTRFKFISQYFLTHREQINYMQYRSLWQRLHLDPPLLSGLLLLIAVGLIILFSASSENNTLMIRQLIHLSLSLCLLIFFAQIKPDSYQRWAPTIYFIGILLLLLVLVSGKIGKGAQRWISLGFFHVQPSEFIKIAVPLMLACYFDERRLPPRFSEFFHAIILILMPVLLTAIQPDLGTALLIACTGACVLLLIGISWRLILLACTSVLLLLPILWHFMHDYQKERVFTFLNPERDPLGHGYHIIQSKIAIGSGGLFGKGWLNGTQSHLQFLPEHATDFIFAVAGEEFGLLGGIIILAIYLFIVLRCLYISAQAQDTFTRILAGSLSLIFFISVFVNIGMVCGILPVVGIPLPLISYGGTSMVTLMIGFGILMSIQTHRKLLTA